MKKRPKVTKAFAILGVRGFDFHPASDEAGDCVELILYKHESEAEDRAHYRDDVVLVEVKVIGSTRKGTA